jgi:hypothetical protein
MVNGISVSGKQCIPRGIPNFKKNILRDEIHVRLVPTKIQSTRTLYLWRFSIPQASTLATSTILVVDSAFDALIHNFYLNNEKYYI